MLVVVLVLLVVISLTTTGVALAALARHRRGLDDAVEVFEAPRPPGVTTRDRRLITVEILNPIELATSRGGRLAGLAGTLAPGLTRRVVYDRTIATLRRELERMAVHADVRMHTLRAVPRQRPVPRADQQPRRPRDPGGPIVDSVVVDEVAPLDLGPDV